MFQAIVAGEPELLAGYRIWGNKGLVGGTYMRNVLLIEAEQAGVSSPRALVDALVVEARVAGASQLHIVGHAVRNEGFFRARVFQRFGFDYRQINNGAVIATTDVPP